MSTACSLTSRLAFCILLTGMPVKVTGGDCQETLKLLPLGVNLADPGMVTGGVACYGANRDGHGAWHGTENTKKGFSSILAVIYQGGPQK